MREDSTGRATMLDAALDAHGDDAFGQSLAAHGPVTSEEVGYLTEVASRGGRERRRRATTLLALAPMGPTRDSALRRLVREAGDPAQWAAAISTLLGEPDAADLARSQPGVLRAALRQDGATFGVAVRAGALIRDEAAMAAARDRLGAGDPAVRQAAVQAIGVAGVGSLGEQLTAMLATERDASVMAGLYRALIPLESARAALIDRFATLDRDARSAVAWEFRVSDQTWVRQHWMERAHAGGDDRAEAIYVLAGRPDRDVVELCARLYAAPPPAESGAATRAMLDREPCDAMLSELAGKRVFGASAKTFAAEWLATKGG